jgi:opacity protein-like surface antigen
LKKEIEETMKKYVLFIILLPLSLFAQWNTSAIKLGSFIPSSAGAGFIVGYEGSHFFDPNVSFGWSIDWYHSNYTDASIVNVADQYYPYGVTDNQLRASTNLHDFPIMADINVRFPITPLAEAYAIGGLGFEALFISYSNFDDPSKNDFKTAFAFDWRLGAGATYAIGPRSEVFGEITYHYSQPSWTYEVNDPNVIGGKVTYERVIDMSGMMFRLGMRFYY